MMTIRMVGLPEDGAPSVSEAIGRRQRGSAAQ